MTPAEIITSVRILINDNHATLPPRFSDSTLLNLVNQLIKRVVLMRPDLFITSGNIATTPSVVEQALPSGAVRLMEIHRVVNGAAIQETNKETLDMNDPDWTTEPAGTPLNWMRHARNPTKYFLYPAPSSGVQLFAEYIASPSSYGLSDPIALPDAYFGAVVDGVVFLAESIDTEHVGTGRAKFYYDSFVEGFSVDFTQRAVVDAENGMVGARTAQRSQGGGPTSNAE